jgi:peptide chain release factor subunit 1
MAPPDLELLRKLAAWETDGLPVTTLYLDVDGTRRPRRRDYLRRTDDLLKLAPRGISEAGREARHSVAGDVEWMRSYVRDAFDRKGGTRGLALFSCSGAGLSQQVTLSRPIRDRVTVGPSPYLLPLEAQLELAETFCTALVDREKARVLISSLGEIEEVSHLLDEVPGRHDQGGWAQARLQRHVEDHVLRHLKHVADVLLHVQQRQGFDHLVLAGAEETLAELEKELHDYVRRRILAHVSMPVTAPADQVLDRAVALESELEQRRERQIVERVISEASAGTGRAVLGLDQTLAALEASRVEVLVVSDDLRASGVRCPSCGHLARSGRRCELCRSATVSVPDLAEEAVERALRQRCRVESLADPGALQAGGGIGALLRF